MALRSPAPFDGDDRTSVGEPRQGTSIDGNQTSHTDQSPGECTFLLHQQDPFPGVNWPTMPPSFDWLTPHALDGNAEPLAAAHYDVEAASGAWNGQPIVSTEQEYLTTASPPCTAHSSMATDGCMPDAALGGNPVPTSGDTSTLHLFDTYVEVMCSYQ